MLAVDIKTFKPIKRFKTNDFIYSTTILNNQFFYVDGNDLYSISERLEKQKVTSFDHPKQTFVYLVEDGKSLYFTKKMVPIMEFGS